MINVVIPSEFEPFISAQLATGDYLSAEDVISDALRLLREQKLEVLRAQIQVGIDEINRGEVIDIEDEAGLEAFFDDIEVEVYKESEEAADSLDHEAAQFGASAKFKSFLADRSREPGSISLEDVERRVSPELGSKEI